MINCGLRCYQRPQQQSQLKTDGSAQIIWPGKERKKGWRDGMEEKEGRKVWIIEAETKSNEDTKESGKEK